MLFKKSRDSLLSGGKAEMLYSVEDDKDAVFDGRQKLNV